MYVALFGLRVAPVLLGCVISLPRLHFANNACYNMGNCGGTLTRHYDSVCMCTCVSEARGNNLLSLFHREKNTIQSKPFSHPVNFCVGRGISPTPRLAWERV